MAKNFPVSAGIHRFLGYPETKTIYSIIDEQFLWISIARHFEFPKIGHGLPSFPVSWFLLVSMGCPGGETRGN